MKLFFKKNAIFLCLLIIFISIIMALWIYLLQKKDQTQSPDAPTSGQKNDQELTQITALNARYHRESQKNEIYVTWDFEENKDKIKQVKLYLNDNFVADVLRNRYYSLPQNVYDFPTGENIVELRLILDNDQTISKKIAVNVDYILAVSQDVKIEGNKTTLILTYVYLKEHPVKTPEILTTGGNVNHLVNVVYADSSLVSEDNVITARTAFDFLWNDPSAAMQSFTVRWKFDDVQDSFDFVVNKEADQ